MKVGDYVLIQDGPHEDRYGYLALKIPMDTPFCSFGVQAWLVSLAPSDEDDDEEPRDIQVYGEHVLQIIGPSAARSVEQPNNPGTGGTGSTGSQ